MSEYRKQHSSEQEYRRGSLHLTTTSTVDIRPPRVSVITVVRNGATTLERTILSVIEQSYTNIEYIVIDGGSTDGTLEIIGKYDDRITSWISEPDKGIYDAMNKGISLATGDLVALLNSDDYYEQGALAAVVEQYRSHHVQGRAILYGNYYILDDQLQVRTEFRSDLRFWTGMSICHQALFVSRNMYGTTPPYDISLKYAADYAFLVDAIRSDAQFIPVKMFLVTFRNAGASYTNVLASNMEVLSVLRHRFGLFSRYVWLFILIRLLKSIAATAAKRVLEKTVSKNGQARLKILYNKLSRRESSRVRS